MTQVIVLNGGSSSGKSSIARALQDILPGVWLTFGTDTLAEALPGRGEDPRSGLVLEPDGTVTVKAEFRAIEEIWYRGLAVMASLGARLILDEVFLAGGAGQQPKAGEGLQDREPQGRRRPQRAQGCCFLGDQVDRTSDTLEVALTCSGEFDAAVETPEERDAQFALELADSPADR